MRLLAAALTIAAAALLLPLACHGHKVPATFAPNHGATFDFLEPPCAPAPRPAGGDGKVLVRYLGVAGLWIEWRDTRILTAPFFTDPTPWEAAFGKAYWDEEAVRRGMEGLETEKLDAVLTGHAHFDHLSDLPPLLTSLAPGARLYANRSAARVLAGFPGVPARTTALEDHVDTWLTLRNAAGDELPVRIYAVRGGHADHYGPYHYAPGEVAGEWTSWDGRHFRDMREGQPFTFLIDLLDADGNAVFRIFHEDSSSAAPLGIPPAEVLAARPVDLAALCMPGHWNAAGYPEEMAARLEPRHTLAIHYDDFFRSRDLPVRFVATLSDGRAREFLEALGCGGDGIRGGDAAAGPDACGCGPCGPRCSMPLPGEWLRFSISPARR